MGRPGERRRLARALFWSEVVGFAANAKGLGRWWAYAGWESCGNGGGSPAMGCGAPDWGALRWGLLRLKSDQGWEDWEPPGAFLRVVAIEVQAHRDMSYSDQDMSRWCPDLNGLWNPVTHTCLRVSGPEVPGAVWVLALFWSLLHRTRKRCGLRRHPAFRIGCKSAGKRGVCLLVGVLSCAPALSKRELLSRSGQNRPRKRATGFRRLPLVF